jgi:hypothetical protein
MWKGLYKIAGVTTVVMVILFLFDTIMWMILGPFPDSAEGWFKLLHDQRVVGLLLLSLPSFIGMLLYYLLFLSLYSILKQVNAAFASLAALFASIGLGILLLSFLAYPLVSLSDQYAMATTESQRTMLITAGETVIADSAANFNVGGLLAEGAALIFSLLMLQSAVFGRIIAILGIVGHGLDLSRIIMNLAFLPEEFGAILLMIGGLPQFIWMVLTAVKLYRLGRSS